MANVYAERIRELGAGREFEVILGRVIAHELGHLVLGKNAHSAAGIMQARWRDQDLGFSKQAAMLFLPREAKRIRAQVLARMTSSERLRLTFRRPLNSVLDPSRRITVFFALSTTNNTNHVE